MYSAKTKHELMIEVWEKLDCESIGAKEIIAIENAVRERFGQRAVDSPMTIARLLADEGAELRHSELMNLYVERASDRPYDPALNNLFDLTSLEKLRSSLSKAENLRRKLKSDNDTEGLRLLNKTAVETKELAKKNSAERKLSAVERSVNAEAVEWITLWLQSPELFENWVSLRRANRDFKKAFGGQK